VCYSNSGLQGFVAQHEEIIATELVVLEELVSQNESTLKPLVDADLMKLYFGTATDRLLKACVDKARVCARTGVYVAMYLKHGDALRTLAQQDAQQETLKDMYLALGKIALDSQLPNIEGCHNAHSIAD